MFRPPVFLLGLLLLAGCSTVPGPQRAALKNAEGFVRQLRSERVRLDDYWFLSLALRHKPELGAAPVFARSAAERFPGDPYLRLLDRGHRTEGLAFERVGKDDKDWPYRVSPPYAKMVYTPYDRVLLRALYCDVGLYDAEDLAILKATNRGDGSYADTHNLVALLLVADRLPALAAAAQPEIAALAQGLAAAQDRAERFDDVFAERLVFLYWAGRGDLMKAAWLDRLVRAQRPDGSWGSDASQGHNLHTTALSLLALLYAAEGRPAQPIYAP